MKVLKVPDILSTIKDGSIIKFKDRESAAQMLASVLKDHLKGIPSSEVTVLGIPRGGVIMAHIIYEKINANSFDIVIPRKLCAPHNRELGIGAIMKDGTIYRNEYVINALKISSDYIEDEISTQIKEIDRRESLYRPENRSYQISNKTIILVDDGAATGATLIAAIRWIRKQNPSKIIVAITVAPKETVELLKQEADKVESFIVPSTGNFNSVGQFYTDFAAVGDEEVVTIMKQA